MCRRGAWRHAHGRHRPRVRRCLHRRTRRVVCPAGRHDGVRARRPEDAANLRRAAGDGHGGPRPEDEDDRRHVDRRRELMPIVEHSPLPTFRELRRQGHTVLTADEARRQDIRALHVGLLNMMPDAAFQVTEQQFMRLVGSSNHIAQFFVHCVTVPGLARSETTQAYIDDYYEDLASIYEAGLDALIVTGANVANPRLDQEPFYAPLTEVIG